MGDHKRSSARSRRFSTRPSSRMHQASLLSGMNSGPRSRRRTRSTSSWRSSAGAAYGLWHRRAPAALRGRQAVAGPDDDVHEQHGAARSRRTGAARRADQGLVRHHVDAASREGLDLPPRERLLDRVHRLVEPHPLGSGARARVERSRLRCSQSGRRREDGGGLRELLGEQRLRRVRPGRVRAADGSCSRARTSRCSARSSSSSALSRRRCSSTSLSPATRATIATCSSPPPAPGRR